MTKLCFPASSNHCARAGFDFAGARRIENSAQLDLQTNANSLEQNRQIEKSGNEYMQMAARMLYDIIREWQERQASEQTQNNPAESKRNRRR